MAADDVCDLCTNADVSVSRTTHCGKRIGVECGCDESHAEGLCDDGNCETCKSHDPDEVCPENPAGHEPDWNSVESSSDQGITYIDVSCKHCGRSGCIGTSVTLRNRVNW